MDFGEAAGGAGGPVAEKGLADDIFPRHKAPLAAVAGLCAIIAQDKVLPFGDDDFPTFGHEAAGGGDEIRRQESVGLQVAVEIDAVFADDDLVARDSDDALDKFISGGVGGGEDDDFPAGGGVEAVGEDIG